MNARQPESIAMERKAATGSGVRVRQVPFDAPWAWLAAGWRDMWTVPQISLAYGTLFAVLAAGLVLGLTVGGLESLILALGGGFLLIGPVAAVGLYEASRRLQDGERITFTAVLKSTLVAPGQLGFFGAILAFLFRLGAARIAAVHAVLRQQALAAGERVPADAAVHVARAAVCWSPGRSSAASLPRWCSPFQ